MASPHILDTEAFVIDGYTRARAFSSFLPGIAGLWGTPIWSFYVNRGQAIAGFGFQDRNHPIMEFLPANRAYRMVALHGFRTFLKLGPSKKPVFYEPFRTLGPGDRSRIRQRMRIRMHDLTLEEQNSDLGISVEVNYFTIPHEPFGALARSVTITNQSKKKLELELIDGLPVIIPNGMLDRFLKQMSRTIEAWVTVDGHQDQAPFFRLRVEPDDRPEVVPIQAGNFAVAFTQESGRVQRLASIIDPAIVFGCQDDFTIPARFLEAPFRMPATQIGVDKTPCALSHLRTTLRRGESRAVQSLFGHADSLDHLRRLLPGAATPAFFEAKARENEILIRDITRPIETHSRSRAFDLYCRQTFLDNVLRGGTPVALGDPAAARGSTRRKVLYVYGRKHGDLERDYNFFVVPPTPYSQGNAGFRDLAQNRRTSGWFHPMLDDENVLLFFSLIQPDGFNPMVIRGVRCSVPEDLHALPELRTLLEKPFTPGELLREIAARNLKVGEPLETFLNRMVAQSTTEVDAEHGEGFWTDHWTYTLDLLESYLALYPERLRTLLVEKRLLVFYDNAHTVAPRALKYQRTPAGIRQFQAVRLDADKAALIKSRTRQAHYVRARHGEGDIYRTTLLGKMLCVIANKLASLDPSGIGIEMEADKPNWYDALNSLPALFGSSSCETFELKRWLAFLADALDRLALERATDIQLPEELANFLKTLAGGLDLDDAAWWTHGNQAREQYRERVRFGFSGNDQAMSIGDVQIFLKHALKKVDRAISKALDRSRGLYLSYFSHEVVAHTVSADAQPAVMPTRWTRHALPLFLEGMVHALRLEQDTAKARALHLTVKKSPLYDRALRMYRVCDSLSAESSEIGRCRFFTPGWLEHQSIWLHMEYKYLLELLRCGLYDEFYQEFFASLIPFQPAKRYGRSILENSSFLVSSVYPDRSLHGNGFVARLSGASAEFLQMWLWITAGRAPFRVNEQGALELRLSPALPKALFDSRGMFTFRFLGSADVTYRNPLRRATYGPGGVTPETITLTTLEHTQHEFRNGLIPAPYAALVREGRVASLDIELLPQAATRRPQPRRAARLSA